MSANNTRFWYYFIRHPIKELRFQYRWWYWFITTEPYTLGHPIYGEGEHRKKNLKIMFARWFERQPKREY